MTRKSSGASHLATRLIASPFRSSWFLTEQGQDVVIPPFSRPQLPSCSFIGWNISRQKRASQLPFFLFFKENFDIFFSHSRLYLIMSSGILELRADQCSMKDYLHAAQQRRRCRIIQIFPKFRQISNDEICINRKFEFFKF